MNNLVKDLEDLKRFTLRIPKALFIELRKSAQNKEIPTTHLVQQSIEEFLKKERFEITKRKQKS